MLRLQSYNSILSIFIAVLIIAELSLLLDLFLWSKYHMTQMRDQYATPLDDLIEEIHNNDDHRNKSQLNHVILFVGVLNRLTFSERRRAIRSTWMSQCDRLNVACMFFIDSINSLSGNNLTRMKDEMSTHQDVIQMPFKSGINFTLRLLWMFKWAVTHYKFDYFLRIDDDHFLCIDRLVHELPHRPKNSLYWGFIHCRERIVRVDEGWLLLTSDLIQEALSKVNTTLECHPFADQAVALWMIQSKYNVTYFYDNDRVINQVTAFNEEKYLASEICNKYISLHGSYPMVMKRYWKITKQSGLQNIKARNYNIPAIPRYFDKCPFDNKVFDFGNFWPEFRFDTKPCKDNPKWSNSDGEYQSREDRGRDDK